MERDTYYIRQALRLARQAADFGEVPVGAVAVYQQRIIGVGANRTINYCDPTAHAEIVALRRAAKRLGNYRLPEVDLFVTLEPCVMCLGALVNARLRRVVFAATDSRFGACHGDLNLIQPGLFNHDLVVTGGVQAEASAQLLKKFFRQRRGRSGLRSQHG